MRVVLLGDSITQGLGSRKVNFEKELERLLSPEDEVVNLALTGTTIDYVETILDRIYEVNPEYAVILYGNVDAMIKPSRTGKVFRRLPKRFRGPNGAMLLPRPFYSHRWYLAAAQHLENVFRMAFRNLVFRIDGTEQWFPLNAYRVEYSKVCDALCAAGIRPVICSTVYLDDDLFPGSDAEYQKYNAFMRAYAVEHELIFIDLYSTFRKLVQAHGWRDYYNYDHFHPNGSGYAIMAEKIAKSIRQERNNYEEKPRK